MEFDKTCCVCLLVREDLSNIYENDGHTTTYYDKLRSFIPDLGWSKKFNICIDCIRDLNVSYDFVKKCTESELTRKDNLPLSETFDVDTPKIQSGEDPKPEPDSLTCEECGKKFKLQKWLKSHVTKMHKKQKLPEQPLEQTKSEPEKLEPPDDLTDVFKDLDFDTADNDDSDFEAEPEPVKKERKPRAKVEKQKKVRTKVKLPVKCEYCGKDFNRKQHLLAHIRCIHTFEKPYECDQCDAKFSLSHSLLVHKRRHNDDRRYVCTYCGKKFLCSTDLLHHNKIHLNKREYKCEPCNKSFNTISVLQIHKKCVHTDPEFWKHICSYCDRRFPIKSSLTAHLRRHTGEKNFSCNICGKSFYDKKMVENHYRSHTDERLFKCHLCEKDYKDRGGLNLHLKKVHDVGNATIPPPPPKKFGCYMCPKAFSSRGKLQKHICTHTGEKMFDCHLCDKKFNDSWYKKVHMQRKHNLTPAELERKNDAPSVYPVIVNVFSSPPQNQMQNQHLQPVQGQVLTQAPVLSPLQNVAMPGNHGMVQGNPSPYNTNVDSFVKQELSM